MGSSIDCAAGEKTATAHRPGVVLARSVARAALAAAVILSSTGASAKEPRELREPEPDRLYARFGFGAATLSADRATEREGPRGSLAYDDGASSLGGVATQLELSMGAALKPGFVLGGTFLWYASPRSELRLAGGIDVPLHGAAHLVVLAPSVDYFPTPRRGFHLGCGIGVASLTAPSPDPRFPRIGGQGGAATAHLGRDWRVFGDLHLGAELRGVFGVVARRRRAGPVTGEESATVATLGGTLSLSLQ